MEGKDIELLGGIVESLYDLQEDACVYFDGYNDRFSAKLSDIIKGLESVLMSESEALK